MSVEIVTNTAKGLIVAPAGCGKTHLIIETLSIEAEKPYLVLTHTTAGVAALKGRLKHQGVSSKCYRVATIDGWALRIAKMFPFSCPIQAAPDNRQAFYPELRQVVNRFILAGHIVEIIRASYSRLLVDEYQDCDLNQHNLVSSLSEILPTIVFGDPLQTIFNFNGIAHPNWEQMVMRQFPQVLELNNPWRWENVATRELGQWILTARNLLIQGNQINLQTCPNFVRWYQLSGNDRTDLQTQNNVQFQIRRDKPDNESFLVIGDSRRVDLRHNFAKVAHGFDVVEPVEFVDIIAAASSIELLNGIQLVEQVLAVATKMMTGVERANILQRLQSILAGRNRVAATPVELAAITVVEQGSRESIQELLIQLELKQITKVFRKGAFSALKDTISIAIREPNKSLSEVAKNVREKRRYSGDKRIPKLAIGSTLLLKGLEADHILILDAGNMNANHLYVALSRGAKSITVFSRSNIVG